MCTNRAALAVQLTVRTLLAVAALAVVPTSLAAPIVPSPRIVTPPVVVSPVTTPAICAPDSTGKPAPCSTAPTLPPLTPLSPLAKPVLPTTISPKTALTGGSPRGGAAVSDDKVLSYFQRGVSHVDTRKAFSFVLMPRSAVTDEEKEVQARFCRLVLAALEFTTPEAAAKRGALATYWPIVATRERAEIETAFAARNCDLLIAWYDHNLARSIAARADVAALSGPLLITWPAAATTRVEDRDPLIVDFAKADHERATKALAYWFRELSQRPELWTSRIREGTIRAELADAINDTAGVVVAVLSGKWESVTAVSDTP